MPRKSKGGIIPPTGFKFPSQKVLINQWGRENRSTIKRTTVKMDKFVIKLSYNSVPVELHSEFNNAAELDAPGTISAIIQQYLKSGFSAPVSWNKTGDDVLGKYGQVTKIESADKMFGITAKLDGVEKEFVWKAFTATEFRKGDYIKVVKNDRGFKTGQLVTPEEYTGQKELSEAPRGKDDIPF